MVLGSSAYSQFAHLPQELAELGEGLCPSAHGTKPDSGASYPVDRDVELVCQLRAAAYGRGVGGDRAAVNRFAPTRQFSRNQSKAAYYPMEVTEATMGRPDSLPPPHDYQYQQGGLRRPHSVHPASPHAPPPRPSIHSTSVRFSTSSGCLAGGQPANHGAFRTSASAQHMDLPSDQTSVGGVTGYHDDLFLISSPQSETSMLGGGTYPGEAGRSCRGTPFMGVNDKTARVPQPASSSCLSPSRSWAVSSVDTVVTSPSKAHPQPSSLAYHNCSNNNGHVLRDKRLDCYEAPQGRGPQRRAGPTSPVRPKRPFVESNV